MHDDRGFVCRRCDRVVYRRGVAPPEIADVIYLCGLLCVECAGGLAAWWTAGGAHTAPAWSRP